MSGLKSFAMLLVVALTQIGAVQDLGKGRLYCLVNVTYEWTEKTDREYVRQRFRSNRWILTDGIEERVPLHGFDLRMQPELQGDDGILTRLDFAVSEPQGSPIQLHSRIAMISGKTTSLEFHPGPREHLKLEVTPYYYAPGEPVEKNLPGPPSTEARKLPE